MSAGPLPGFSLIINKRESVRTQRGELHGHIFYGVFVTVLLCILLVYPRQPMTAQRLVMFEFPTRPEVAWKPGSFILPFSGIESNKSFKKVVFL